MLPERISQRLQVHRHESSLGSWTEARALPHPALAPFVSLLWYGEGTTFYTEDRILPQGSAHLLINLGPAQYLTRHPDGRRVRIPFRDMWLSGPQTSYLDTEAPFGTALVGVAFRPHGAYPVFGLAQTEIAGRVLALADVVGDAVAGLAAQLEELRSASTRLELVESWLLMRLRRHHRTHPVVPYLVGRIASSRGKLRVRDMARDTGFSRMHLSRLFLREVGLSPKRLARLHRFHAALNRLEAGSIDWAELALDCGYYDQSHLSRDFRDFAGRSPDELLKSPRPDDWTLVVD